MVAPDDVTICALVTVVELAKAVIVSPDPSVAVLVNEDDAQGLYVPEKECCVPNRS